MRWLSTRLPELAANIYDPQSHRARPRGRNRLQLVLYLGKRRYVTARSSDPRFECEFANGLTQNPCLFSASTALLCRRLSLHLLKHFFGESATCGGLTVLH
jgi:hypothetical protein